MGDFAVLEDDQVSKKIGSVSASLTLLAGTVGGLLGAAIVVLRNVIIQSIFTKEEPLSVYPADVAFVACIYIDRGFHFRRGAAYKSGEVFPHGLVPAIRRSTAVRQGIDPYSSCYVLVERNHRGDSAVRALLEELKFRIVPTNPKVIRPVI
jgi:hypothetical protein